jgi:hypothetical protein
MASGPWAVGYNGAWGMGAGWATANSGKHTRKNRIKNGIREFGQEKPPTDFDPDFAEFYRIFPCFRFFPENAVFDR